MTIRKITNENEKTTMAKVRTDMTGNKIHEIVRLMRTEIKARNENKSENKNRTENKNKIRNKRGYF